MIKYYPSSSLLGKKKNKPINSKQLDANFDDTQTNNRYIFLILDAFSPLRWLLMCIII